MEGPTHLLSLKVMRVSRPELASAWQPFYSSSPSFSAHSTASILSLQGTSPLPGHPKTLRDITQALELLTLPSSFGSIQLGETFSSCLCVNNEAEVDVEAINIKVEMQTATTKVLLAEMGVPNHKLAARDTFEGIVHHEIKELGQHVLACAVTYRLPPNAHQLSDPGEHAEDPSLQTLRKFYKFAVTNPLSVKTKVHVPKSPSALFSLEERDKVFLEVHIQNLTQEAMHFERIRLECVEGWDAEDVNVVDEAAEEIKQVYSGSQALMQPQDIRQYIYILKPKSISLSPLTYTPGSVVPLGRLDILWRSSFGEPGRLLTSMLSRRIPMPLPVQSPASAIPQYLKRSVGVVPPSRPQTPQLNQSRPGTPPLQRPISPQNRPAPMGPTRPQSPLQVLAAPLPEIETNLIIRDIPRDTIRVEKPFTISFALILSSSQPIADGEPLSRVVKLVVQHLQPPKVSAAAVGTGTFPVETFSPRLSSSGASTPVSTAPVLNYTLAHQKIAAAASPHQRTLEDLERDSRKVDGDTSLLPPPHPSLHDGLKTNAGILHIGPSLVPLAPIELRLAELSEQPGAQVVAVHNFELSYMPTSKGYATVGGLRILVVEERIANEKDEARGCNINQIRVLKEWDIISEVWVSP